MESVSSWELVGFITAEPQWELEFLFIFKSDSRLDFYVSKTKTRGDLSSSHIQIQHGKSSAPVDPPPSLVVNGGHCFQAALLCAPELPPHSLLTCPCPHPSAQILDRASLCSFQTPTALTSPRVLLSESASVNWPLLSSSLLGVAPNREKQTQKQAVRLGTP